MAVESCEEAVDIDIPTSAPPLRPTSRISSIDWLRGFIMVLMALDHTRLLTSKFNPTHGHDSNEDGLHEAWYDNPSSDRFTWALRFISHPCAPGFFFLLGASLPLLIRSRMRAQWSILKISRFIMTRSMVLILLGFFLCLPLLVFRHQIYLSVMWALGCCMLISGILSLAYDQISCRASSKFNLQNWASVLIFALLAVTMAIISQVIYPARTAENLILNQNSAFNWLSVLSFISSSSYLDKNNGNFIIIGRYPFLPWLSPTLWGVSYGYLLKNYKELISNSKIRSLISMFCGIFLLLVFIIIRLCGGFGNAVKSEMLHYGPEFTSSAINFLTIIKYSPSLAYIAVNLSINHLILAFFDYIEYYKSTSANFIISDEERHPLLQSSNLIISSSDIPTRRSFKQETITAIQRFGSFILTQLMIFGSSPLFFYVFHFVGLKLCGTIVQEGIAKLLPDLELQNGFGVIGMFTVWIVTLAIMSNLCKRYANFKKSKSVDSIWRIIMPEEDIDTVHWRTAPTTTLDTAEFSIPSISGISSNLLTLNHDNFTIAVTKNAGKRIETDVCRLVSQIHYQSPASASPIEYSFASFSSQQETLDNLTDKPTPLKHYSVQGNTSTTPTLRLSTKESAAKHQKSQILSHLINSVVSGAHKHISSSDFKTPFRKHKSFPVMKQQVSISHREKIERNSSFDETEINSRKRSFSGDQEDDYNEIDIDPKMEFLLSQYETRQNIIASESISHSPPSSPTPTTSLQSNSQVMESMEDPPLPIAQNIQLSKSSKTCNTNDYEFDDDDFFSLNPQVNFMLTQVEQKLISSKPR